MRNFQTGPQHSADLLLDVVSTITYKPGWSLELKEALTATVSISGAARASH